MRGIVGLVALAVSGCTSYSSMIVEPPDQTFMVSGQRADVADCVHARLTREYNSSLGLSMTKDRNETHVFAGLRDTIMYGGTSAPLLDITFTQASPTQTRVDYRGKKSLWGSSYMLKDAAPYIQQCGS